MPRGVPNVVRQSRSAPIVASTDDFQHADWEGFLDMTAVNPAAITIEVAQDDREFRDNLEYTAFMNEPVGIRIAAAMHERESPMVPVGVNQDQQWLPREANIMVRRYHLERLLRSTQTELKVVPLHDPSLDEGQRTRSRNIPAYHIQILRDPNPMGARWAARMRREGC